MLSKILQGLQALTILWVATVHIYEIFCFKVISPARAGHDNNFAQQQFFYTFFHCAKFGEEACIFLYLIQYQYQLSSKCSSFIDYSSQCLKQTLLLSIPIWFTLIFIYQSSNTAEVNLWQGVLYTSSFREWSYLPFDIMQIQSKIFFGILFVSGANYVSLKLQIQIQEFSLAIFNFGILTRFMISIVLVVISKKDQFDQHVIYFPIFYTYLYAFSIYASSMFWPFEINENTILNASQTRKQNKVSQFILNLCDKNAIIGDIIISTLILFSTRFLLEFIQINEKQIVNSRIVSILTLSFGRVIWIFIFYIIIIPIVENKSVSMNVFSQHEILITLGGQTNEILLSTIIVLQKSLQFTKGMQVGPYNNGTVLLTIGGLLFIILCVSSIIYQLFSTITFRLTTQLDRYQEQQKTKRVAAQIRLKMISK